MDLKNIDLCFYFKKFFIKNSYFSALLASYICCELKEIAIKRGGDPSTIDPDILCKDNLEGIYNVLQGHFT